MGKVPLQGCDTQRTPQKGYSQCNDGRKPTTCSTVAPVLIIIASEKSGGSENFQTKNKGNSY